MLAYEKTLQGSQKRMSNLKGNEMNARYYVMDRFKKYDLLSRSYIKSQPSLLKDQPLVDYNMPLLYHWEET